MNLRLIVSSGLEYDELFSGEAVPDAWEVLLINSDDRSDVISCLSLPGMFDHACYWPVIDDNDSLPSVRRIFRIVDATKQLRNVTAKHMPAGLYGSRWLASGLQPLQYVDGTLTGCDVLHGPVAFRPSLAASLLSHGQAIDCRRFTESLCISVALAYRRCCYAVLRDLRTWDRPELGNLREYGWSSKIRGVS